MQPSKPFLTIDEQVALLRARGMRVPDDEVAAQWLRAVGYYRLSGYWHPFWDPSTRAAVDQFSADTDFDEVVGLYEFDRHLKNRMLSAIERIEVAMRSQVGHTLGRYGPMAHLDAANFDARFVAKADHMQWLATAFNRVQRMRSKDPFVEHHFKNYHGRIPIWVLTEVLDFSDLSKIYAGMHASDKDEIADWFGVIDTAPATPKRGTSAYRRRQRNKAASNTGPGHILENWLEQLTIVRNICAHHARVWNRTLLPIGTPRLAAMDAFTGLPPEQSGHMYGAICVSGFLLRTTSPGNTWIGQLHELVDRSFRDFRHRTTSEMGFPQQWRDLPLWSPGNGC